MASRKLHLILMAALGGLALLGLHIWSLRRYPAPYVDEAWLIARTWRFLQTGEAFGTLDIGVLDRAPNEWRTLGYLGTWLQSLGLLGADQPGLAGPRAVALAFGFGLLVALVFIGRALAGWGSGLLAALITGLSGAFFYSAHLARPDVIAAAFAYGGLAIHLMNERRRFSVGAAAGFCWGLGLEIHPNAVLLGPTIAGLFLIDFGLGVLRQRHLWGFVTGVVAGVVFHLASHVLPDPAAYVASMRRVGGPVHTPPLLTWDPRVIAQAFAESVDMIGYCFQSMWPVLIASLLSLLWKRDRLSLRVATIALGVLLTFTLLVRSKQQFYLIWFVPALNVALATFLFRVFTWQHPRRLLPLLAAGTTAVVMALMLYDTIPNIRADLYAQYTAAQRKINAVVGPHDSVMGRQQYWLGLTDHVFYSWEGLVHYFRTHPGGTLEQAFAERKPDIFIIDSGLAKFISDQPHRNLILETLRLPARQMTALLEKRARPLLQFESYYGPTVVFRLRWDLPGDTPAGGPLQLSAGGLNTQK